LQYHQATGDFRANEPAYFYAGLLRVNAGMHLDPGEGLIVGEIVICPADLIEIFIGNENIELERGICGHVL
jgi:hypothetical protein